jgi:hypothetical protein
LVSDARAWLHLNITFPRCAYQLIRLKLDFLSTFHQHLFSPTENELFDITFIKSQPPSELDSRQSYPNPKTLIREAEVRETEPLGSLLKRHDSHTPS